jgi:translation initiation factor 6
MYAFSTDSVVIIPKWVTHQKAQMFGEWLKATLIHTTIGRSVLVGAFVGGNSYGLLLPYFTQEKEIKLIKSFFHGNITIMDTKETAYGNMVLANDKGAIVDPRLEKQKIKHVSDTLDVETVPSKIAGLPYVGSLAVATNKGVLTHPLADEQERSILNNVLKVPVDLGTINCGIPYVGTGMIGNKNAAIVGLLTTGPEMFIIGHALDVVN